MGVDGDTDLQVRCRRKFLVLEEVLQFLLSLHLKNVRLLGICAEDADEVFVFPLLDVVVTRIHTVDVTLNRVAFIADNKSITVSTLQDLRVVAQALT